MTSLPCVLHSMSHGPLQLVHFLSGKKHKVSDYPSLSIVNRLANTQSLSERPACKRAGPSAHQNNTDIKNYSFTVIIVHVFNYLI